MIRIILFLLVGLCCSCNGKDKYAPENFLSPDQQKSFMMQAVKFMYYNETIPANDRLDPKYQSKYDKAVDSFALSKLTIEDASGTGFFLIVRKYGDQKYRGILGRITLGNDATIKEFEELAVTPLLDQNTTLERSSFLFSNLVKTKEIEDKYIRMKSYVEWPDERTRYDKEHHQWRMHLE